MSTTVLMEQFDTQMLDSGDADISMYSANSSLHWLSVEASMTDDAYNADTQPHSHQSIEIEMEDHDDEITEYEMADEVQDYRDGDADLLDVDVLDASLAASPRPETPVVDETHITPDFTSADVTSSPLFSVEPAMPSMQDVDLVAVEPALVLSTVDIQVASPMAPHGVAMLSQTQAVDRSLSHQELTDTVPDSVTTPKENPSTSSAVVDEANSVSSSTTHDSVQVPSLNERAVATLHDEHLALHVESHGDESQSGGLIDVAQAGLVAHTPAVPLGNPTEQQKEQPVADSPELDSAVGSNAAPDVNINAIVAAEHQQSETVNLIDDAALNGDPLEISEGVYIDPPPAVLLSVSSSTPSWQCCLFNQPLATSSSQSLSDTTALSDLTLVLHHRPTLYYEPLSAVFDALRQEERFQSVFDLENGELVLDAYDLQLVISEDNVHVQEVTLHDLNVLHDGADLTGPLRLELRLVSPRFISRYNALRDQIARLDLAEDEDSYHDVFGYENVQDDDTVRADLQEHDQYAIQTQVYREEEAASTNDTERADNPVEEENGLHAHDEASVLDASPQVEETAGDSSLPGNPLEEEHEVDHDEGEADTEIAGIEDEETGNSLDTDDVHQHADAGEGGDYEQFSEDVEDDNQQFRSDLPEVLDGSADDDHHDAFEFKDENATDFDDNQVPPHNEDEVNRSLHLVSGDLVEVAPHQDENELDDADSHSNAGESLNADVPETLHEGKYTEDHIVDYIDETHVDDAEAEYLLELNADGSVAGTINPNDDASSTAGDDVDNDAEAGVIHERWVESPIITNDILPSPQHDGLSRKASTATFSSKSSKRGHDELELDNYENVSGEVSPSSSPDSKRLRLQ